MDRMEIEFRTQLLGQKLRIEEAVRKLGQLYEDILGLSISDINYGSCWDFAVFLQQLFPEGRVQDNETLTNDDPGWTHAFLLYEGRYYDSEAPEGVEDWRQLPCCKRCTTST